MSAVFGGIATQTTVSEIPAEQMSSKAWIGGDVAIDGATNDELHARVQLALPGAMWHTDAADYHLTLLYHGHPASRGLASVCDVHELDKVTMRGEIDDIEAIVTADGVYIVLSVRCADAQALHARVRADVMLATGEEPRMKPHLGPDGAHVHHYDFHPHITLAKYTDAAALEPDRAAVAREADACRGRAVTIGPFRLH